MITANACASLKRPPKMLLIGFPNSTGRALVSGTGGGVEYGCAEAVVMPTLLKGSPAAQEVVGPESE